MPSFRCPGDLLLRAEREALHLRIRVGQLDPAGALRDLVNRRRGEVRRRRPAIRVVDQHRTAVVVAGDVHRRLFARDLAHLVLTHVHRKQLRRRLQPLVEIDRVAVLGPEADRDVAVEPALELAERLPAIADVANVHARVRHAVAGQIVGRAEGDPAAVRREADAGLAHFAVVAQPLDLSGRRLQEIDVAIEVLRGDVALVAIGRSALEPDPLAVGADGEIRYRVGPVLAHLRGAARFEIQRPQARGRRLGIPDVDGELLVPARLVVGVGLIRRERSRSWRRSTRASNSRSPVGCFVSCSGSTPSVHGIGRRYSWRASAAPGAVDQRLAILGQGEIGDAILRIGNAPRFPAVRSHQVDLVLRGGARRGVAIREKQEAAAVPRPCGRRLVFLGGEGQLPGRRHALVHRHEEEVSLPSRFVPVRERDGVQQPAAVRARRRRRRRSASAACRGTSSDAGRSRRVLAPAARPLKTVPRDECPGRRG